MSAIHSLRLRLPLLISLLIAAVLAAFTWASYSEVEHAFVQAGGGRAQIAADQLSNLMAQGIQPRLAEVRRIASDDVVRRYLADPTEETRASVAPLLTPMAVQGQPPVTVWDADGRLMLEIAGRSTATMPSADWSRAPAPPATGVSPFQMHDNVVYYEVAATVFDRASAPDQPDGRALGRVAIRRTVSGAQTADVINRLVGDGALIEIGNRDGGIWTDLTKPIPSPPVKLTESGVSEYQEAGGRSRLGAVATIRGTPWSTWVEFPHDVVVAPARAFLRRMIIIALALVVLAATGAAVVSRRITTPLRTLTTASEAIASGDYSRRVASDRPDEIGRLGAAFNTMTEQVEGMHRDLEQRVRERTIQLESAVQQLESFSYSVSHDLRAPLRHIVGFSRILVDEHLPQLPEEAAAHLRRVVESAQRMGRLIDDLLAFARLGRTAIRRSRVDSTRLVREVIDDLRAEQNDRNVEISVADLPSCEADPALLKQVYANLIGNSLKFTKLRPTARIDVGYSAEPDGAVYFIKDNGAGFDMKYADKLFGVFQRLHRAEDYEGTGVGLAIVQRIISRHGGRVWADAKPDEGACFFFTIGSASHDAIVG